MLLIKRYGIPLVLTAVLYSFIYALFGRSAPYYGAGLAVVLLQAYLIRVCDDFCDYQRDRQEGKAPVGRGVLIALCCALGTSSLLLALFCGLYLMLIPLALILIQLALPERWRDIIKPFFLPAIVITLVYSTFEENAWVFAVASVLAVADVILILIKKKGSRV